MWVDEFAELQGVVLDFLKRSEGHRVTLLRRVPGHQPNILVVTCHLCDPCVGLLCGDARSYHFYVGNQKSAERDALLPKIESQVSLF